MIQRNHKVLLLLGMLALGSTSMAFGYVAGSSNLDIFGYPPFEKKNSRPMKPYVKDEHSLWRYKLDVEEYVNAARRYAEAADNDVERVAEEKGKAIRAANEVVEEYNRFVRYGY